MTYDAAGRPISGTATSIEIDLGDDGIPDIVISGISVAAATLDDGPASFWRFLEGNDLILGPEDGRRARRPSAIHVGGRRRVAAGRRPRRPRHHPRRRPQHLRQRRRDERREPGGRIAGVGVSRRQRRDPRAGQRCADRASSGDVGVRLRGKPADRRQRQHPRPDERRRLVRCRRRRRRLRSEGGLGEVVGGNDYITVGRDFRGEIAGDVSEPSPHERRAGRRRHDQRRRPRRTVISGDVYVLRDGRLIGGDDTIDGGGGNDVIAGDAYEVRRDSIVTGGDDLIYAGGGNDEVYGDAGYGPTGPIGVGGNDRIYGEDGNDRLLRRGRGRHHRRRRPVRPDLRRRRRRLALGRRRRRHALRRRRQRPARRRRRRRPDGRAGPATTPTSSTTPATGRLELRGLRRRHGLVHPRHHHSLPPTSRVLRYNGVGNFTGIGNGLDNTIAGSAGDDRLEGGDGNDVLDRRRRRRRADRRQPASTPPPMRRRPSAASTPG